MRLYSKLCFPVGGSDVRLRKNANPRKDPNEVWSQIFQISTTVFSRFSTNLLSPHSRYQLDVCSLGRTVAGASHTHPDVRKDSKTKIKPGISVLYPRSKAFIYWQRKFTNSNSDFHRRVITFLIREIQLIYM